MNICENCIKDDVCMLSEGDMSECLSFEGHQEINDTKRRFDYTSFALGFMIASIVDILIITFMG